MTTFNFGPHPCKSRIAASARLAGAVADGRPSHPRAVKPVPQRGAPSAGPSNPNSRVGRSRSPVAQGWDHMDTTVVGIDVSKDRLDVHVRPAGTALSYSRDAAGIEALIGALAPVVPQIVAVEATGGFETVVAASLAAAGLPVVVVNPARVRAFAASLGQRAKTDRIDARVIAQFAAATRPPVRSLPDAATQALADLVTRRRQIVQMIVAEAQREKRASARAKKSIQRLLKSLRAELSEIDGEIDESVRGSAIWRGKEDLLASVPGVGSGTARTMLAELPELGTLNRRQ